MHEHFTCLASTFFNGLCSQFLLWGELVELFAGKWVRGFGSAFWEEHTHAAVKNRTKSCFLPVKGRGLSLREHTRTTVRSGEITCSNTTTLLHFTENSSVQLSKVADLQLRKHDTFAFTSTHTHNCQESTNQITAPKTMTLLQIARNTNLQLSMVHLTRNTTWKDMSGPCWGDQACRSSGRIRCMISRHEYDWHVQSCLHHLTDLWTCKHKIRS